MLSDVKRNCTKKIALYCVSFIQMDEDIPTTMIIHWKEDPTSKPFKTKSEATTALGMDPEIWKNYKFSK